MLANAMNMQKSKREAQCYAQYPIDVMRTLPLAIWRKMPIFRHLCVSAGRILRTIKYANAHARFSAQGI